MEPNDEKLTLGSAGGSLTEVDKTATGGTGNPVPAGTSPVTAAFKTLEFSTPKAKLIEAADMAIRYDLQGYPRALSAYSALTTESEALALWDMSNFMTMRKLGYNDHGRVHAWVTGAASMAILQLLLEGGVKPDVIEAGIGDTDDAFLIVILGTMLHDIGNSIHRVAHESFGVTLALPILNRLLEPIYPDPFKRTKIRAFILHCIDTHDLSPLPLTIEAGVTAVADGTDITKGRGRKAFQMGSVDIHSISALAVDSVTISRGETKPVEIEVTMNNSGGIFQVEEIMSPKVIKSPLFKYVELIARTGEKPEERILYRVRLSGATFVNEETLEARYGQATLAIRSVQPVLEGEIKLEGKTQKVRLVEKGATEAGK